MRGLGLIQFSLSYVWMSGFWLVIGKEQIWQDVFFHVLTMGAVNLLFFGCFFVLLVSAGHRQSPDIGERRERLCLNLQPDHVCQWDMMNWPVVYPIPWRQMQATHAPCTGLFSQPPPTNQEIFKNTCIAYWNNFPLVVDLSFGGSLFACFIQGLYDELRGNRAGLALRHGAATATVAAISFQSPSPLAVFTILIFGLVWSSK